MTTMSLAELSGTHPSSALERRVLAGLDVERIAQLTEDLVRAGGENPGGREEAAVAVLETALRAIGATVTRQEVEPGRPNLVARIGDATASGGILFLGHSDVVPAGEGWTGDPFEPRRVGDDIIGRGATDMKGGLAAVVAAMQAVHLEAPDVPLTLVCTVDEEVDATGVLHYIDTAEPARFDACIVAEPTGMVTVTGCRGATNMRIEVSGASAHAGEPSDGASAILAGADVITVIERDADALRRSAHPMLGHATWNVGTIIGGHGTSIVPDLCVLSVDRRTLPGEEPEQILRQILDDARAAIEAHGRPGVGRIQLTGAIEMTMPGFVTDPGSTLVDGIRAAVREAGGAGETSIWTASCEGGFIARHHGTPTVVLGPGDLPGQAHQPDERVSVTELLTAARAYALIALRATSLAPPHVPTATL